MKIPEAEEIASVLSWFVKNKAERFYKIIGGNLKEVEPEKDIAANFPDKENTVMISSVYYGRGIFFNWDEFLEEFKK